MEALTDFVAALEVELGANKKTKGEGYPASSRA